MDPQTVFTSAGTVLFATFTSRRRMLVVLPLLRFSFLSQVKAQEGPIRVDVNLVNLYVAVSDSAGKPVDGLRKENFRIWEDSVEQGISHFSSDDVPFTVGLILDRSGSMQAVIDDVYKAALHAIEASTAGDEAFVIVFNDRIDLLQEFTSDQKTLQHAASKLRAGGQTALYDAVYTGLRHIQRGKNRKKALLVVTDGADNSSETQFRELLDAARQSEVILHVIGLFGQPMRFGKLFEDSPEVDKLSQLAAVTGGRADFPKNMEQCKQACINVARELHRQYSIGYYPTNAAKDSTWRSIRIELVGLPPSTGGGIVRTREGYYAPREAQK